MADVVVKHYPQFHGLMSRRKSEVVILYRLGLLIHQRGRAEHSARPAQCERASLQRPYGRLADQANFEKSTFRMSPELANSVWNAKAALSVAGVWPPLLSLR